MAPIKTMHADPPPGRRAELLRPELETLRGVSWRDIAGRSWPKDFSALKVARSDIIHEVLRRAEAHEEKNLSYPKQHVIELLGEYRAIEAGDYLAAQIQFSSGGTNEVHPLAPFPAAIALADIGNPWAERGIGRRLGGAVTDKELLLFAWVLRYIEGDDENAPLGLHRLEYRLKRQQQRRLLDERRLGVAEGPSRYEKNLARLIEVYKSIDPDDSKRWPKLNP